MASFVKTADDTQPALVAIWPVRVTQARAILREMGNYNRNLKFLAPKSIKTPIIFPSPGLPAGADPGPIYPAGDVRREESGNGVTPSN